MTPLTQSLLTDLADDPGRLTLAGAPQGVDARVLARLLSETDRPVLHIAREDARLDPLAHMVRFFHPEVEVVTLPAWDCLPYDRVGPNPEIAARRMSALYTLATAPKRQRLLLTTVNAVLQRVPPRDWVAGHSFSARPGDSVDLDALTQFLTANGYARASQVTEPGEYAVRGGLVDLYPTGGDGPVRLDFFGDELDTIRRFDPASQRTTDKVAALNLLPASEFTLDADAIKRFRRGYVAEFGPVTDDDPLYEAVSDGRRHQGAGHWLPLFHDRLDTVFDLVPGAVTTLDHQGEDAARQRLDAIADYYDSRRTQLAASRDRASALNTPYKPLPPDQLYLSSEQWAAVLDQRAVRDFTPFQLPDGPGVIDLGAKMGRDFAPERQDKAVNVYDAVRGHLEDLTAAPGRSVLVASYSVGARERLQGVLEDHGVTGTRLVDTAADMGDLGGRVGLAVLPLEHGLEAPDLAIVTEQDVLGDRLVRQSRKSRRADNFLREATALSPGDLVVHVDHGVGRFLGLETVTAAGAAHDTVALEYAGGDKLYLPVENIEMLSRYGSEETGLELDKLGGGQWQAKKARLKQRIREMADQLIAIAAARELKPGKKADLPAGLYDEFAARFPYTETGDQLNAIAQVIDDLGSGRPMDRLVCGDVGFGKTEVALRAAFVMVMAGYQVAVVAPTTLLVRQHFKTFCERFRDYPVNIAHLSRLVTQKEMNASKKQIAEGTVDIAVGTHALLSKTVTFKNLGLVIVDEEQHFGVAHKERLKEMKKDVHVLTLTATPIPRTLQLAMSGIRDLSIIATPPVDRLAVRTFVLPFDPMVVREALLREHYRGGQSFYVCPRISDLAEAAEFLRTHVPEVKFVVAHGQMAPGEIEDTMTAFYEGKFDVLLSTTIVESGLDIPTANTMVVHRAHQFGLAQLYQLRGRVGRAKIRAYCYLTTPANRQLTGAAERRLGVLQSLDTLGAGFTLASHDMDIRGAGNLLGEEQSGHVREVGVELYQQMLEEAVAEARAGDDAEDGESAAWSPTINVGATVLIPDSYVGDLELRMGLYRRLAELRTREEIDAFAAELIDRFGALPPEVKQLIAVITIKAECLRAGIEKIEAGPKGLVVSFRANRFANPEGLVQFISKQTAVAKLRPDHSLLYKARMETVGQRLKTAHSLARGLARIAEKAQAAA
ncbi:transcription-repair coupling factor [Rhodothalassium salexigens DSM 2132]|uniref:Transcription-repair-coupling factor n=1 Tax=Rhodothalassium salexigens DSM 2132 TaxID=1188247 RepID=A0A4R2PRV4_RHOSA|nr:transcription-repair coupling factor [Rhodothalassium salexigens]MBB4210650.1 transcription-repair coupling factor (superfamily II helicase) [Rhodothalassium salexigens DSM 2132]TCP37794.1 transcription-repair coupling factor [Rhodothalassium salexigens DSM 2132]